MLQKITRLFFPLLITLIGLYAVLYYESTNLPFSMDANHNPPIGFVQSISGFHLRVHKDADMWTPLQRGDQLFAFDEIKTGTEGELKITIPSTSKTLSIDSESHVVLEADPGKVTVKTSEGSFSLEPLGNKNPERKIAVADDTQASCSVPPGSASFVKDREAALKPQSTAIESVSNFHNIIWREPAAESILELNPDFPKSHQFTWEGSRPDWQIQVEWGPSRRFFEQKRIAESQTQLIEVTLPIGKQYWRWSVLDKATGNTLYASPVYRVIVEPIYPPAVVGPSGETTIRTDNPTDTIELKWLSDSRFDQFEVEVSRNESFSENLYLGGATKGNSVEVKLGHYGMYYWRLAGIQTTDGRAIRSKVHSFRFLPNNVEKIKMQWITFQGIEQFYVGKQPILKVQWASSPFIDRNYVLKVKPADGGFGRIISKKVRGHEAIIDLDRPGTYEVSLTAFNDDSDIVGQLDQLRVSAQPKPNLRAPALAKREPEVSNSGHVYIQWDAVESAVEYQVEVRAPDGMVFSHASKNTNIELKKLFPGVYSYRVHGVDQTGNLGDPSTFGRFIVPEKSSLRAPKLKKMEVE